MNNNNRRPRENTSERTYKYEGYSERGSNPRTSASRNYQSNQPNPYRREDSAGSGGRFARTDDKSSNFRGGYNQRNDDRPRPNPNSPNPRPSRFAGRTENAPRDNFRRPRRDDNAPSFRDNRPQRPPSGEFRKRFDPKAKKPEIKKLPPKPKIVSDLQITDGKHAGKYITTTTSPKYRATPRKLRETMFKILARRIRARRFLDLFSGNGMIGFEAISRGALLSTFVERSARLRGIIRKNMESLEIKEGHAELFEMEAIPFLKNMCKRKRQWDVMFLSPPFDTNYEEIFDYLKKGTCVRVKGVMVIEHHSDIFFPEKMGVLHRTRTITENEITLSFYERK